MSANETLTSRIETVLADPLAALGLDLEAVEVTPAGNRRVLRVAVDQDGGVTMDDVAAATREVGTVLDETEVMGSQPYTLEVTSRGVDRPLTLPRHWRRNADRLVKVKLVDGSSFTGRICDSGDETVVVEVSGTDRLVTLADVQRALVQIEFNRKRAAVEDDLDPAETDELDDEEIDDVLDDDTDDPNGEDH
ncbi:ribosome maturation factor RimP [soil metagenome]